MVQRITTGIRTRHRSAPVAGLARKQLMATGID